MGWYVSRFALFKAAAYSVSCLALLASCSGGKQTSSKVSIEIPSAARFASKASGVSAQSSIEIRRIMINVRGTGLPLQSRIWQKQMESQVAPSSFDFEAIPYNTEGVIQVLVVAAENSVETFFYAKQFFKANKPYLEPSISLSKVASGMQGSVAGRIITDGTTDANQRGPSGKVDVFIHPEPGEEMLVDQSEIFSGWFEFYAMSDLPFSYRMAGQPTPIIPAFNRFKPGDDTVFQGPSPFAFNSTQAIRAYIPPGFRGGSGTREPTPARFQLLGFFGAGTYSMSMAQRYVCVPNAAASIKDLYVSSASADPALRAWEASTTPQSLNALVSAGTGGRASGYVEGQFGTSACMSPSVTFLTALTFDVTKDSNNGGSGRLGFYAPFVTAGTMGDVVKSTVATGGTGSIILEWTYLPGVSNTSPALAPVQGADVFARVITAAEVGAKGELKDVATFSDGYDCANLVSRGGFRLFGNYPSNAGSLQSNKTLTFASNVTAGSFSAIATLLGSGDGDTVAAAWDAGRLQFVVCPYQDNVGRSYFSSAQAVKKQSSGGGGGTVGTGTFIGIAAPFALAKNECTPVVLYATDGNGDAIRPTSGDDVNVTAIGTRFQPAAGGPSVAFYTNAACSTVATFPLALTYANPIKTIYVNSASDGVIVPQFTVAGAGVSDAKGMSLNVMNGTRGTADHIAVGSLSSLKANVCHPVLVYGADASGMIGSYGAGKYADIRPVVTAPYDTLGQQIYTDCYSAPQTAWTPSPRRLEDTSPFHVFWLKHTTVESKLLSIEQSGSGSGFSLGIPYTGGFQFN